MGADGGSAMTTTPPRRGLVGAGSRAYDWVRKALGFYGTAVTLMQLLPAVVALLAVTLSPTAWLSATLRRWVSAGVVVGTVVGAALFALALRAWWRARGQKVPANAAPPLRRLRRLAVVGLSVAGVALVVLRVHFAVIDVGVVERYPVLTPVFDFYLGGSSWQAASYNVVAAVVAGVALAGLVLGAPAAAMHQRDRRRARAALLAEGGPLHALDEAAKALSGAKQALDSARATILGLTDERDALRAELARREAPGAGRGEPAPRADHS